MITRKKIRHKVGFFAMMSRVHRRKARLERSTREGKGWHRGVSDAYMISARILKGI